MEEKCTHLNTVTHTQLCVLSSHFVVINRTVEEALILPVHFVCVGVCVCVVWEISLMAH